MIVDPQPQRKQPSVGLFKKKQDNELEDYESLNPNGTSIDLGGMNIGENFGEVVDLKLKQMQENPQQYFNFGFTYCDFKSYLLKLTYCRSIRKFTERKRLEKIAQFQKTNTFSFGFQQEYESQL